MTGSRHGKLVHADRDAADRPWGAVPVEASDEAHALIREALTVFGGVRPGQPTGHLAR